MKRKVITLLLCTTLFAFVLSGCSSSPSSSFSSQPNEVREVAPYISSLQMEKMEKKDIAFFDGKYELSALDSDELMQLINEFSVNGVYVVGWDSWEVTQYDTFNELLSEKAVDYCYIGFYDESWSGGVLLHFANDKEGEENYTVQDCLDKNLWYLSFYKEIFENTKTPLYGTHEDYTADSYNMFDITFKYFGQPDYYYIDSSINTEDLCIAYVRGDYALYINDFPYQRGNKYVTDWETVPVYLIMSKELLLQGDDDCRHVQGVVDTVNESLLNTKYIQEWRTPGTPVSED